MGRVFGVCVCVCVNTHCGEKRERTRRMLPVVGEEEVVKGLALTRHGQIGSREEDMGCRTASRMEGGLRSKQIVVEHHGR